MQFLYLENFIFNQDSGSIGLFIFSLILIPGSQLSAFFLIHIIHFFFAFDQKIQLRWSGPGLGVSRNARRRSSRQGKFRFTRKGEFQGVDRFIQFLTDRFSLYL